jgi:hypothetical protein
MKMAKVFLMLFFTLFGTGAVAAEKMDNLIIYGDNFMVSAKEPSGWKGDSTNASAYHVNLVFYRNNESIQNAKTVIRVLIANKTDENTIEDLKYDMESYRKQYPKVQFKDISVKHPEYMTFPKLFYVANSFYEYVTYLNPGTKHRYNISVSMNLQKTEATKEDMQAYSSIIESIKALK